MKLSVPACTLLLAAPHATAFVTKEVSALLPKGYHWPALRTGKHFAIILQLIRQRRRHFRVGSVGGRAKSSAVTRVVVREGGGIAIVASYFVECRVTYIIYTALLICCQANLVAASRDFRRRVWLTVCTFSFGSLIGVLSHHGRR